MRKLAILVLLGLGFVLAISSYLQAQPLPPQPPPPPPPDEDMMNRIEMMKIWKLTELLKLSPEQSTQIFPILQRHEKQFREKAKQKDMIFQRLRVQLKVEGGGVSKAEAEKSIRDVMALEQEAMQLRKTMYDELANVLTSDQLAKYLIFESAFNDEISQMIRDIRQHRHRGPHPDNRGNPPDAPPPPSGPPPNQDFEPFGGSK